MKEQKVSGEVNITSYWGGEGRNQGRLQEEAAFELNLTGQMEFGYLEKKDYGSDIGKGGQESYSRERQEHKQQTSPARD